MFFSNIVNISSANQSLLFIYSCMYVSTYNCYLFYVTLNAKHYTSGCCTVQQLSEGEVLITFVISQIRHSSFTRILFYLARINLGTSTQLNCEILLIAYFFEFFE